jgi:hypothetical protein
LALLFIISDVVYCLPKCIFNVSQEEKAYNRNESTEYF